MEKVLKTGEGMFLWDTVCPKCQGKGYQYTEWEDFTSASMQNQGEFIRGNELIANYTCSNCMFKFSTVMPIEYYEGHIPKPHKVRKVSTKVKKATKSKPTDSWQQVIAPRKRGKII